ncbi:polysaccharide deacetylase family protein [Natronorubrum daqingense]|uniref:Peptidoglycan/xylan/chitin deacetylase, PgdA/CDA1 family n=1 Tax=Natronorubrum daqingense TaxID=588898 RepID=A0A1N7CBC3_9EURY|nr:polysaccharide deacetylase family protein [Natronorubrum daqingense]APX96825.1 polysaccharide deacetylase [Natronorubrum daqingense]SIR60919.1 Peptidoglycan/xylan/chitin deacetylase, PgdA/CDA1 family [Natronorubrum daqingense]
MNKEHDSRGPSRRWLLSTVGVASAALAGCTDILSDEGSGDDADGEGSDDSGSDSSGDGSAQWPAIEAGEQLSDFEDLDEWFPQNSELSAAEDEARIGSQAAVVESDGREARIDMRLDGIDLEEWDVSLAVKPEAADQIVVEFLAPDRDARLNTVRTVPDGYEGWFRLDCGYEHKPEGEPDLSNVTRINVVAVGSEDGETRMLVDDLRRTEAADNGKAILAFYGGYDSHYDIAAEMLEERDWTAAVPMSPDQIGADGRMGLEELQDLQDRGWDVCSHPQISTPLPEMPEDRQRDVLETNRDSLEDNGFEDGARHLFVPDDRMDETTVEVARDVHDSAFLFGSCPSGVPPTGMHTIPLIWGPALHNGVRRHINLADQYNQLTVMEVPRIVDEEDVDVDENRMSLDDFEHLLNHIEHRGLDVITPSDLVDGTYESDEEDEDHDDGRPDGTILEEGQAYEFDDTGSTTESGVDLEEGVASASFTHDGDDEFVVELVADGGGSDVTLVTTDGNTAGESIAAVEEGSYGLEIQADGEWTIDLSQPEVHADDLDELGVEASGTGSSFVGPIWAEDDVRLEVAHDGDGEFLVDGYDADGASESIVSDTGSFDSSRSFSAGGTVWINVEADGDWSLEASDA